MTSREQDLIAEGEPEREFHPGVAERMPRKRIAGGALLRDQAGRVLFIEPTYKPTLEIPGGVAEKNESPLDTCHREIHEELGLDIPIGRLLVVDWVPEHGVWGDAIMFIFDGGMLTPTQIADIKSDETEVRSIRFLNLDEAIDHMRPSMARRLRSAVDAIERGVAYTEFGREATTSW